jgi:hypothetical protein
MEGIGQGWHKSSYSGNGGADCVEVGHTPGQILVRDTKQRNGHVLRFPAEAWQAFITHLKTGHTAPR